MNEMEWYRRGSSHSCAALQMQIREVRGGQFSVKARRSTVEQTRQTTKVRVCFGGY